MLESHIAIPEQIPGYTEADRRTYLSRVDAANDILRDELQVADLPIRAVWSLTENGASELAAARLDLSFRDVKVHAGPYAPGLMADPNRLRHRFRSDIWSLTMAISSQLLTDLRADQKITDAAATGV